MKNFRMMRPGPMRDHAVQIFSCGPFQFNVNKALKLAANSKKYTPQQRPPSRDWVGPFIDIDENHIEHSNLSAPVIFATLLQHGEPWRLVIDGNHRVLKALRDQVEVKVIVLDMEDTLKIMNGPVHMIEQMKRDGQTLGLLKGP